MENTYPDGDNYVCADCGYEWPMAATKDIDDSDTAVVKDSNGNVLGRRRCRGAHQGFEGEGFIDHAQDGHQGQKHPTGRRRP